MARLSLTRRQIVAFRRRAGGLDERLAPGARSIEQAARAGLQDSMPRAALLSIHARVRATTADAWEHPALVQVWGPRFSAYAIAARDVAVFTLGRLPDDDAGRRRAFDTADRLASLLGDRRMPFGRAGRLLGAGPNSLRYAAPTGRVLMRWDGARQPEIWMVPAPAVDPGAARRELARRHLHAVGPTTPGSFAAWAGIAAASGAAAFDAIRGSLIPVRTPIGEAWMLARDEPTMRAEPGPAAPARLLPSGDAFWLLHGRDRELLVPDAARRAMLWTPRVWPGAVLVDGDVVGTWRRAHHRVAIEPWRRLSAARREAVAAEAEALPIPGAEGQIVVDWVS
jgi:hypothetical protein